MRCILKNGVFLMWRDNGFVLERHDILIENHTLCGLDENSYADRVYDLAGRTVVPAFSIFIVTWEKCSTERYADKIGA